MFAAGSPVLLWTSFQALAAVGCVAFQMFVTDYRGKIFSLNFTGEVTENFDVNTHVSGMAVDSSSFGDTSRSPSIVYGTDNAIYRMQVNGSNVERLYESFGYQTERLVIDSASGNIYYTAYYKNTVNQSFIAVLTPFGYHFRIVNALTCPRGIALHPGKRRLFWSDWGTPPYIGSAYMDGSDRTTIVSSDLMWPNGIAIDFRDDMLYWVDGKLGRIEKCDGLGNNREVVLLVPDTHLMDILIDGGFLYFSNWDNVNIIKMKIDNFTEKVTFATVTEAQQLNAMAVYIIEDLGPATNSSCNDRHGLGDCSDICLPTHKGHVCACDENSALLDGHTCTNAMLCPEKFLNGELFESCRRHRSEQCGVICGDPESSTTNFITCEDSKWNDPDICLKCPSLSAPENGFMNDTAVIRGTIISFICDVGYSLHGAEYLTCGIDADWNNVVPVCLKDCNDLSVKTGVISPVANAHGSTVHIECASGFYMQGHSSVTCLDGVWSPKEPQCLIIPKNIRKCPRNKDDWGTVWEETFPDQIVILTCRAGSKGDILRQCSSDGVWLPPLYNCLRADVSKLIKRMAAIKENPSSSDVSEILNEIGNFTASQMSSGGLYAGEVEGVTDVLETLANISNTDVNITANQSKLLLTAASNIIDESNQRSWQALSSKEAGHGAAKILKSVEMLSTAIVKALDHNNTEITEINATNIVLKLSKISKEQVNVTFHVQSDEDLWLSKVETGLSATLQSIPGSGSYAAAWYKTFDGLMPYTVISQSTGKTIRNKALNSPIVSLQLISDQSNISSHVDLIFQHEETSFTDPYCAFWDFFSNNWKTDGCRVKSTSTMTTVCVCNHLTNFAVLMSPWTQDNVESTIIEVISIVFCSISVAGLIITAIAHVILWRYIKSDRAVILINLCVALTASYVIFLSGVNETANVDSCTVVAVLLQYIYLVVFCLMLAEGLEIAMSVLYVFARKTRTKWTIPLAWVIPAVIVGISMAATKLEGYGTEKFCWLSVDNGLIWAFVGPALLVIVVNAVILILVLKTMAQTKSFEDKKNAEKIKSSFRCLGVLLPLIGCTWILGILYVNNRWHWIQYMFSICNGLQGFFIFLFHVCLNQQLRVGIKKRQKLYKDSGSTSATSVAKHKPIYKKSHMVSSDPNTCMVPVKLISVDRKGQDTLLDSTIYQAEVSDTCSV